MDRRLIIILLAVLATCQIGAMQVKKKNICRSNRNPESKINFETLNSSISDYTVVDVRTRAEVIEQGQLPGSHVLPVQELESSLELNEDQFMNKYGFPKLNSTDPNLVLTCRSGRRVGVAHEFLKTKGFQIHKLYCGSFLDWTEKQGPLIKPGQPFETKPQA